MTINYQFPAGDAASEIPLWINFAAIPYHNFNTLESRNRSPLACVAAATVITSLPFSGTFKSINDINYTRNPMDIIALIKGADSQTTYNEVRIKGLANMLEQDFNTGIVNLNTGDPENVNKDPNMYMSVDMMDTMFKGSSIRSFTVNCNLVCKSAADSIAAARVCSILSSRCWPLLQTVGVTDGNAKLMHPDIWVVWISTYPARQDEKVSEWIDGDGPQISVLTTVSTARIGGENERVLAINKNLPGFRTGNTDPDAVIPLIYQISLDFTELEPAIQDRYAWSVINRSRALMGNSAAARAAATNSS